MRSIVVTQGAAGVSPPVILDQYIGPFNIGLKTSQTGTNTAKLQVSFDDPYATYATDYNTNADWIDLGTPFDALSGIESGALTTPCRAIRINITAYTSGSVALTVVQSGLTGT